MIVSAPYVGGVPSTSNVKHSPETCPNRPLPFAGTAQTALSRQSFSSEPLIVRVADTFPNGSTPSTWPRVIGYLPVASGTGYTFSAPEPGQKSDAFGSVTPTG